MANGRSRDGGVLSTDITDEEEFRDALRAVAMEARSNGVDIRGSWPLTGDDETQVWDVVVTEISDRSVGRVRSTEFPVSSVMEAVAAREGVSLTDLPPLQESLDPTILERLQETSDGVDQFVRFEYCGYRITVHADDTVVVDE